MSTNFQSKRLFLNQVALASAFVLVPGGLLLPKKASADPFIIGSLLGGVAASVIAGLMALSAKREEVALAVEQEARRTLLARKEWIFQQLPLSEQLLMVQSGEYFKGLMSSNADGFSSMLAVNDGVIQVSRGQYGSKISSDQAIESGEVLAETGVMPIPTRALSMPNNDRLIQPAAEYIDSVRGDAPGTYLSNYAPMILQPVSLAARPTVGGEDFHFLTSIARKRARMENGTMAQTVDVEPISRRVLRT